MISIEDNYRRLRESIPEQVTLVVAAKQRTAQEVREVIRAGATDIGENYVQQGEEAFLALDEKARTVRWHLIGHLQRNKINKALKVFDLFQTIDSIETAAAVNKRVPSSVKTVVPVLIEVNIGAEESKAGIGPQFENIQRLAMYIAGTEFLQLEGLMTIGPLAGNPEDSRPYFRQTRAIFENLNALRLPGVRMKTLSMGMSNSYRIAIEEGSNMVRVGTAIFGPRG